jgi:hypothetical protein
MAEVTMNPAVVDGCADAADGTGGRVTTDSKGFAGTDAVVSRHATLASAQALQACRTGWSGRIGQDGADITATGRAMHQAVREYLGTDAHNADAIHGVGGRTRAI